MDLTELHTEFPRDAIHWRAQTVTKSGDKALALAYLDARDVMDRLDSVCGPENWQSRYIETAKGRVLCEIGIRIDGEWVWKSDGAGDTDIEGEKGGISGALKRAAVQWGIGRYLYRLKSPWVPCETFNGKWRKWTDDPWKYVRGDAKPAEHPAFNARAAADRIKGAVNNAPSLESLGNVWRGEADTLKLLKAEKPDMFAECEEAKDARKGELASAETMQGAA